MVYRIKEIVPTVFQHRSDMCQNLKKSFHQKRHLHSFIGILWPNRLSSLFTDPNRNKLGERVIEVPGGECEMKGVPEGPSLIRRHHFARLQYPQPGLRKREKTPRAVSIYGLQVTIYVDGA